MEEKRRVAMEWWYDLTFEEQLFKVVKWLSDNNRDTTERHPHHLTGREIEQIYNHIKSV